MTDDLRDAIGVPLKPGQMVLYCSVGLFTVNALLPAVIVRAYVSPDGRQWIQLRRPDNKHLTLRSSRRVVVRAQPQEAANIEATAWLKRQLSTLDVK